MESDLQLRFRRMSVIRDLRFAVRLLSKRPRIAVIALLSLTLGIGTTTAVFSIVDGIYLRPLGIRDPEKLVWVESRGLEGQWSANSYRDFEDLRREAGLFERLAAVMHRGAFLHVGDSSESIPCAVVSENYFDVLGAEIALGSGSASALERRGGDGARVVLSHKLWRERYAEDPEIVGKPVRLGNTEFTVAGVTGRDFRGLERNYTKNVWMTRAGWTMMHPGERQTMARRQNRNYLIFGYLQPDVTVDGGSERMAAISANLAASFPESNGKIRFALVPDSDRREGSRMRGLLLEAIMGLVLVVACFNVANLLSAETEARRGEISIRLALGAGRWRILRQLGVESLVLAGAGAALGMAATNWLVELAPALLPGGAIPVDYDFRIDFRVLFVALAATTLSAILVGLLAGRQAWKGSLLPSLKSEGRDRGGLRLGSQQGLVAGQVAFAVVLMVTAGLLIRSFRHTVTTPKGFDTAKNLLVAEVFSQGGEQLNFDQLFGQAAEDLERLPGVTRVAYARRMQLSTSLGAATVRISIPGREMTPGEDELAAHYNIVSVNYFDTVGTRVLSGRPFERTDSVSGQKVTLLNKTLAQRYWPRETPIGRALFINGEEFTIIGVTEDTKNNEIYEERQPYLYMSYAQAPSHEGSLLVETEGNPASAAGAVREKLNRGGHNLVLSELATLDEILRFRMYSYRVPAQVASAFGLIGVLLAAVGLYGLISFNVSQRSHEIGIRMALGARSGNVVGMIVLQGIRLAAVGIPFGFGLALAAGVFLRGMLHGVNETDPATYGVSAAVAVIVAVLACLGPAAKAARVAPATALRHE